MSPRDPKTELIDLLDALCEERLTAEQAARLERLVLRDRAARKLYLDYLHLHGTLLWDAAHDDGVVAPSEQPAVNPSPAAAIAAAPVADRRRARRAWILTIAGTACLVAIALLAWRLGPTDEAAPQIVDQPPARDPEEPGPTREEPHYRPIVLDRPAPRAESPDPIVAPRPEERITPPADIVAFVDERIDQGWKDAGVQPSDVASDGEWLRRISLDLAGRIPSAADVEAFLADSSPDKRRAVIDRLLASPDFDRHFATVWTNLLVGRSEPEVGDRGALLAFLRESFARNRPWSDTVAAFVAAEGPIDADPAANFLVAHLNNEAVPATAITARVFLGTQVQCMQCHNHPFNDWTQQDFWELNSFFQQTALERQDGKPVLESKPVGGPTLFETRAGLMQAAYPKYHGREIPPGPGVNRRTELAKLLAEGDNPQFALAFVNRTWAQLLGAGFTNPVDDMGPHNPPSHPEALDHLSRSFVASGYDVRQLVRWIVSTQAYGLSSRFGESNGDDDPSAGQSPLFSRAYPKPMTAEQVYDSLLVATRSDPPSDGLLAGRDAWARQFVRTYETDENDESVNFQGTVPQALALMNGQAVQESLAIEPGTTLHAALQSPGDDTVKLRRLALATLSRPLEPKESAALRRLVRQSIAAAPAPRREEAHAEALQDAFWALLNSAEFVTVP